MAKNYSINPNYNIPSSVSTATITKAINDLQNGNYDLAYRLYLKMMQDSRLVATLSTRTAALFKEKIQIINSNNVTDANYLIDAVRDSEIKRIFADYLFFGVGIGRIEWIETENSIKLKPMIKHHLLNGLRYDLELKVFYILNIKKTDKELKQRIDNIIKTNGRLSISYLSDANISVEIIDPKDPKWFIIDSTDYGFLFGLINSVSYDWLNKQLAQADLNNFNYTENGRIWKFKYPVQSDPESTNAMAMELTQMAKDSVIALPQSPDINGATEVEMVDPTTASVYESFYRQIKLSETNYAVAILGNNLTTEIDGGSYAAAETHKEVQDDLTDSDKETLFRELNGQFLDKYRLVNNANFKGEFLYQIDKTEDTLNKIDALNQILLVAGFNSIKEAGFKVNFNDLIKELNVPFIETDDSPIEINVDEAATNIELAPTDIARVITVNEARASQGLGPLYNPDGSLDPRGDLSVEQYAQLVALQPNAIDQVAQPQPVA